MTSRTFNEYQDVYLTLLQPDEEEHRAELAYMDNVMGPEIQAITLPGTTWRPKPPRR